MEKDEKKKEEEEDDEEKKEKKEEEEEDEIIYNYHHFYRYATPILRRGLASFAASTTFSTRPPLLSGRMDGRCGWEMKEECKRWRRKEKKWKGREAKDV